MVACPRCGSSNVRKELEQVYEIDDTKYFDFRLVCDDCLYTKPFTASRKNPVPRARDAVTEMTASLKLRDYMPQRKEEPQPPVSKPVLEGLPLRAAFSPLRHSRELFVYGGAILLGLMIEIAGLYFESYLRALRIDPLVGFTLSLMIFVLGPIIIAGSLVYYVTRDRLKAILFGSMAVPLTIIILARIRAVS
ncbi:MAG: hypothetical protein D6733_06910 [Methanobacteriota archaeon]|nr:MAG: hypothetical protein D6733_06910 [Euryarchaeota archaeon]